MYSCFTGLCQLLLYNKVSQLSLLFFGFLPHVDHLVHWLELPGLYSRFSLVIYFIHSINSVYMSIPVSHFIPLPSHLPSLFSMSSNVILVLTFPKTKKPQQRSNEEFVSPELQIITNRYEKSCKGIKNKPPRDCIFNEWPPRARCLESWASGGASWPGPWARPSSSAAVPLSASS